VRVARGKRSPAVLSRDKGESRIQNKNTGITVDVQVGDKTYVARYLEGRSASGVQCF